MKKSFFIIYALSRIFMLILAMSLSFTAGKYAYSEPVHKPESLVKTTPTPAPLSQIDNLAEFNDLRSWTGFKYREEIARTASKYDLDPQLIYATIMTESQGNRYAYRYEPALGEASYCLGQILESTARSLGFNGNAHELYDPEVCIDLIGRYHRKMIEDYGELTPLQLARAYNSGSPWKRPVWGHINRFTSWYYEES